MATGVPYYWLTGRYCREKTMKTAITPLSSRLIRFLTGRDPEKSFIITLLAVTISGIWLLMGIVFPVAPGAVGVFAPEALLKIRQVLLISFTGNLAILLIAWPLRDKPQEKGVVVPHLIMAWAGAITVWTAHLLGLMSSVGMAAVPVMAALGAAVFGIRRAAAWSAITLLAIFLTAVAEIRGILPVAPLSSVPLEQAYRHPVIYLPSFLIIFIWTTIGIVVSGTLVEALHVQSAALADSNSALTGLVNLKNRLARSASTTIRDHLNSAWHLSRSARDILRGMNPPDRVILTGGIRGYVEGSRWAESSLQISEHSLAGAIEELDRLTEIAAVEAGHDPLQKSPVALAGLAREIFTMFEPVARVRRVRMTFDAAGLLVGRYDLFRLRQAFTQIIGSAVGHTPPGGQVAVIAKQRMEEGRRFHLLEVVHTGNGFPDDLINKYGSGTPDPSPLPHQPPVRTQGLALVNYWVRRHGGFINIENVIDGCRLTLHLPVESPRAAIVTPSEGRAAALEQTLRAAGHTTHLILQEDTIAQEGPGVWMSIADPDVIVVELAGESASATRVIRSVRSRAETARIPVVALTLDEDEETLALHEGFDDYIRWASDTPRHLEHRLELLYHRQTRL